MEERVAITSKDMVEAAERIDDILNKAGLRASPENVMGMLWATICAMRAAGLTKPRMKVAFETVLGGLEDRPEDDHELLPEEGIHYKEAHETLDELKARVLGDLNPGGFTS